MKKSLKRHISKTKRFEQSNFDASFANLECSPDSNPLQDREFQIGFLSFFEKKIKNNKKRHLEKDSSSKIWNQICNP